ncbi:hypothetical protein DUNSADRAFT_18196 [Dunaliella salina]|uniref:Uncharacterized protein n=1 Tax=Dunaliella salina TaxID=3046 RepID=A0ABQ7G0H1_DUNSA|nr:hypothetical protein DUNSADRAFT_18196 [Dunaliella salina]KAF5828103.1 hypothetical protein DUNSADRAFT_18196 [Dunaliella salina]|eukprot:KAF5828102.1 hypothetical protein DUNSADRAFT_18196 [Dunaliella salina]
MSGQALYDACRGGNLDGAAQLIKAGANVNWANEGGWTPLCTASGKGHKEVVRLLLDKGAAVDKAEKVSVGSAVNQPMHHQSAFGAG